MTITRVVHKQVRVTNSRIEQIEATETIRNLALVARNGRASVTIVSPSCKALDLHAIEKSLEFAQATPHVSPKTLEHDRPGPTTGRIREPDTGHLQDWADAAIGVASESGADRLTGSVQSTLREISVAATDGFSGQDANIEIGTSFRAWVKDGSGHAVRTSVQANELDVAQAVREATRIAAAAAGARTRAPMRTQVLLTHLAASELAAELAGHFSAPRIIDGTSLLSGRVGTALGSEHVTFSDQPDLLDSIGRRRMDDLGHATKPQPLVERGTVQSGIHDVYAAAPSTCRCTGHCQGGEVIPWNLSLHPGSATTDKLIEEMGQGVVVTNLWYTRMHNPATGEFSSVARDGAFLVERGEISGPAAGFRLSSTFPSLLSSITHVGRELQQVRGWRMQRPVTVAPFLCTATLVPS